MFLLTFKSSKRRRDHRFTASPHAVPGRHGHLALRQGACLVAADHRGTAQRLHGRQLPHQHVLLHHVAAADGERDGDAERDALGDRRDGQGDRYEHHVEGSATLRVVAVPSV